MRLKDFKNQTAEHGIVPRLLKYLLKNARQDLLLLPHLSLLELSFFHNRKHANVDDTSASQAAKVSEDDVEKAKMEWAAIQFSDDKGLADDGDK